jgi:uncharacterized protein
LHFFSKLEERQLTTKSPRDMKSASCALVVFVGLVVACQTPRSSDHGYALQARITDNADLLSDAQEDSLMTLINSLETEVGSQLAVLTVPSLNGEKIEDLSIRMAEASGLGRATHNDGILITIAREERKVRIEVGIGLERVLTDEIAAQIISDDIAPEFRSAKYGLGLYRAIERMVGLINTEKDMIGKKP